MSENTLDKIIKKKIEKIDLLKKSTSLKLLIEKIDENKKFIDFKAKIQNNIKDKNNNQALQKQRSYRIVIISCEL